MIFGFNTDVRCGETLYHVQSEPRAQDHLLETQVFVGGRCLGKRAASYAEWYGRADFSEDKLQELLETQHRVTVEAARAGRVEDVLGVLPCLAETARSITLEWLNESSVFRDGVLVVVIRVAAESAAIAGAKVVARLTLAGSSRHYFPAVSDENGVAEIIVPIAEAALASTDVLVQASVGRHTATRKFRLRPTS